MKQRDRREGARSGAPFATTLDLSCPFCGGWIHFRLYEALHAVPYCFEFARMDAGEFLTAVRRKLGLPEPSEPS